MPSQSIVPVEKQKEFQDKSAVAGISALAMAGLFLWGAGGLILSIFIRPLRKHRKRWWLLMGIGLVSSGALLSISLGESPNFGISWGKLIRSSK